MRRGLTPQLAAVIVVLIIASTAVILVEHARSPRNPGTTTGTGTPTASTTSPGGTTGTSGKASLEGVWKGTYHGMRGSGEWTWVIKRSNTGYTGCLRTSGTYSTGGSWVPLTVTVENGRITLGTVAMGGVTFTGSVNGGSASGSWTMAGGADRGDWQGRRVSSTSGPMPCGSGGQGGHTTTTTTHTGTTTTSTAGGQHLYPYPPIGSLHDIAVNTTKTIIGVLHLTGEHASHTETTGNMQAVVETVYIGVTYNPASPNNITAVQEAIVSYLEAYGYTVQTLTQPGSVAAFAAYSQTMHVALNIGVGSAANETGGGYDVTILVQAQKS
ncbi:MAG: hypothetical protein LRS48_03150 [Desulfurococcales archaeon]|nr:hypothetical protein [Desulfurococcales archaeon]